MTHQRKYLIGTYHRTLEGKVVKIINESLAPGYVCVKGDDNVWRYDREGKYEDGRVTGTKCYPPDLRNFEEGSWLDNPVEVSRAFGEREKEFTMDNYSTIKAVENACLELDRLYTIAKAA